MNGVSGIAVEKNLSSIQYVEELQEVTMSLLLLMGAYSKDISKSAQTILKNLRTLYSIGLQEANNIDPRILEKKQKLFSVTCDFTNWIVRTDFISYGKELQQMKFF